MDSRTPESMSRIQWRPSVIWAVLLGFAPIFMLLIRNDVKGLDLHSAVFFGSCLGAVAIAAFWIVTATSIRELLPGFYGLLPFGSLVATLGDSLPHALLVSLLVFLVGGVVILPILIARLVRTTKLQIVSTPDWHERTPEVFQFRTIHLMVFISVVAVLLSVGESAISYLLENLGRVADFVEVSKLGIAIGFSSALVCWATLGRRAWLRTLISIPIMLVVFYLCFWYINAAQGWLWVGINSIVWAAMAVYLWLLRFEGFRFVVSAPTNEPDEPPVAA